MEGTGSPWEFAGWLNNCCRDASVQLGLDEVTMALYTVDKSIDLVMAAISKGHRNSAMNLGLLQLLHVKAQLIVEVSDS